MSVAFNHIPSNVRVPGAYFEPNPVGANAPQDTYRALIIAQVLAGTPYAAAGVVGQPVISLGVNEAKANAGTGSMGALDVARFRGRNSFSELWVLPVVDDAAAVAATGTFVFTGPAAAYGTLVPYIDAQPAPTLITPGMTAAQMATAVAVAINALPDMPVTAAASTGTVTVTAKNKGLASNDIDLRMNYRGALGGEFLPAGVAATVTAMSGGTTNPSLTTPLLSLADMRFEVIICPYNDSASLDAMKSLMDENTGRWSWQRKVYGHVYAGKAANLSQASTFGPTRNDQHVSVLPMGGCPLSPHEFISEIGAAVLESVSVDPALPLQFLPTTIPPPLPKDRFAISDRNVLLFDGLCTFKVVAGVVEIERMVTGWQVNAAGVPDTSYLNCETMHTLGYVARDLDSYLTSRFLATQRKLVADNIPIPGGSALVNPALIKASLDTRYRYLCEGPGVCQDAAGFAKESRVELVGGGRVNIWAPIRLAGQLRILAVSLGFSIPT